MKIAQIAPLMESVPPTSLRRHRTCRFLSLTEELVAHGHDVTLFASGDSITSARTRCRAAPEALRLNPKVRDPMPYYMLMLEAVRRRAHEFDILHFHIDYSALPRVRRHRVAHA